MFYLPYSATFYFIALMTYILFVYFVVVLSFYLKEYILTIFFIVNIYLFTHFKVKKIGSIVRQAGIKLCGNACHKGLHLLKAGLNLIQCFLIVKQRENTNQL